MSAINSVVADENSEQPVPRKTLRVLHLNPGNLFGGIETYLLTLARCASLVPEMEPQFGVCFPGRFRDELSATGLPVHNLGAVRISRPWTVWRARRRLKSILRDTKPDVVVVHSPWSRLVFGSTVRNFGIPLAAVLHGPVSSASRLDRWAANIHADLVLANSEHTSATLDRSVSQIPDAVCRYPVAPIGKSIKQRSDIRRETATPLDAFVIVQVSRMERWKGQHILLQALSQLNDIANWECWIVGGAKRPSEAAFQQELQDIAAQTGNSRRIKFLGKRSDVNDVLRASDLFCQPNVEPEPFGIVFIEALYAGLPIATSNFGGGAEIVTSDCGILTSPGDVNELARALRELIADPIRRNLLATAGPTRASELCDPRTQINALYLQMSRIDRKSK